MLQNLCKVTDQVCGEAGFNYLRKPCPNLPWDIAWIASRCILDYSMIWNLRWKEAGPDCSPPFPQEKTNTSFLLCFLNLSIKHFLSSLSGEQLPMNFPQPHCSVNVSICRDSNSRVSDSSSFSVFVKPPDSMLPMKSLFENSRGKPPRCVERTKTTKGTFPIIILWWSMMEPCEVSGNYIVNSSEKCQQHSLSWWKIS